MAHVLSRKPHRTGGRPMISPMILENVVDDSANKSETPQKVPLSISIPSDNGATFDSSLPGKRRHLTAPVFAVVGALIHSFIHSSYGRTSNHRWLQLSIGPSEAQSARRHWVNDPIASDQLLRRAGRGGRPARPPGGPRGRVGRARRAKQRGHRDSPARD